MKRINAIIAVAMAVTVWQAMPAFAAKIDVGGEMRARGYIIQSNDFTKEGDNNWLDARFRLDAKVSQGMTTGVVQVDFLNASAALTDGETTGNLVLGNSIGNSYPLFAVRQAYLAINFPLLTIIGGRYEVKLGNGLVLNDTTDIVAVNAPIGPVNLLVGYLILGEDDAPVPAANPGLFPRGLVVPRGAQVDDTAFAVNAGIKNIGGSMINGDLFFISAHLPSVTNTPGDDTTLRVIGLTGDGKIGPANVGAELDFFMGTFAKKATTTGGSGYDTNDNPADQDIKGTNFLLTGALPSESVGLPVGLSAAIIYASGQSTTSKDMNINAIDGDFRASNILVRDDFNNYEGLNDIGNAGGLNAGLQAVKVAATLPSMKGAGMTHTPEIGLVWAQTSEDVEVASNKKSSDLGIEIYANTNCVVDPNLSANIGLAYLSAGDVLGSDTVGDGTGTFVSPENQLKLEASLTFHF